MAIGSALDGQHGFADESTYGTPVAPARWFEVLDESVNRKDENVDAASRRPGSFGAMRSNRWVKGRTGAEGSLGFEVFGLSGPTSFLLKHLLGGTVTTTTDTVTAKKHVASCGSLTGKSFTYQKAYPDVSGTLRQFTYSGGKVLGWEFSNDVDGILQLSVDLDFQKEDVSTALGTAAYPAYDAADFPLTWVGGEVEIAGSAVGSARSLKINGKNNLKTDRYFLRSSGTNTKKEPIQVGGFSGGGEIVAEFEDMTAYTRFTAGTVASVVGRWSGPAIEVGKPQMVEVKANAVRFVGATPDGQGTDVVTQNLPFEILDDGTNPSVTITVRNLLATP